MVGFGVYHSYPIVSDYICRLVSCHFSNNYFYKSFSTPEECLRSLSCQVGVVIVDITMMDDVDVFLTKITSDKRRKVIVFYDYCSSLEKEYFKRNGVLGGVPSNCSLSDLFYVVREVSLGRVCFFTGGNALINNLLYLKLTSREKEILRSASKGLMNKDIALERGISIATVKAHMAKILTKLNVNNRTQAVSICRYANETVCK